MSHYDPRERDLGKTWQRLERMFPERQLMVRSGGALQSFRLGSFTQLSIVMSAVLVVGWMGFASYMFIDHEEILESKNEEVVRARSAYKTLVAQVSVYRDKVSSVTGNLERNHSYTMSLLEQNNALDERLQAMQSELETSEAQRAEMARQKDELVGHLKKLKIEAADAAREGDIAVQAAAVELQRERALRERNSLRAELSRLEDQMGSVTDQVVAVPEVNAIEAELRKVVVQRDLAQSDADALRDRVAVLEEELASLESTQLALFQRFAVVARDRIGELEGALDKTGLDLEKLLKDGEGLGRGGPFVPLDLGSWDRGALKDTVTTLNEKLARWNGLQTLAESLPLAQPVEEYYVSSHFGPRKDPINGDVAFHQGLDMAAPHKTPAYAGGPGKVVYAGWRGRYGRLVEIDHGNGLKTRYGHLGKILVKRGDRVDRGTKIGLVGTSGRSTGPHLHYEVLVGGKPRNPFTFIKAGSNVFKG